MIIIIRTTSDRWGKWSWMFGIEWKYCSDIVNKSWPMGVKQGVAMGGLGCHGQVQLSFAD